MKKKIIIFFITIIIIFSLVALYSRYIGTSGLVVKEYKLTKETLNDDYHGLKIVHFSDLHYYSIIHKNELENIVEEINLLKPDLVFFTGDLFAKDMEIDLDKMIEILSKIEVTIGKFAISGNHDIDLYEDFEFVLTNSGFTILDDKYEYVYKNSIEPILITGLSSNIENNTTAKDRFEKINEEAQEKNSYSILLLHEPDYIEEFDYSSYDLILAGHSHNGQIRLPFIGALYTPFGAKKYYDEYYKLDSTNLYISSGLGASLYNIRLFNKPSINFYRLMK